MCGADAAVTENKEPAKETQTEQKEEPKEEVKVENVKTGLSVAVSAAKSASATAEKNGSAQVNITLVAVTVDDNGVVDQCVIDMVQANVNFDAAGQITSDVDADFPTKNELGADYGMVKASSIGKEWNEQAAAFCEYVTGKTVSEVAGIAVNENGKPADADLASSVTVGIGSFQELIAKAAD